MLDADRRDMQEKQLWNHTADKEQQPLPGGSSRAGNLSQPQKKLQEAICVLLVELCERFTFFGIVCNMILFCTVKLGYRNYQAAIVNMCFVGTSMLTPVLVGWLAECLVGRIKLVCICMFLHFLGTALLPVVAFPFEDVYIDRRHILHTLTKREQKIVFYFALLTASLGIGGIRAIVCPLSAYSLEDCGPKELLSFFNWFYWLVNLNSAVVFVSISYIQQSVARNLGFLIPFVSVLMAIITIHMVRGEMIYKPKTDSSLLTTFGVIVSALKMSCVRYRYFSGGVTNRLDHAKENYGGQYSETQVESTKSLTRLFPLFTFQILYRMCIMQIPSGYYLQTMNSNLHFSGFVLPVAAMNVISIVPLLILVPILECINSNLFSSKDTGHSPTIYIVVGQFSAALSVMVAGFSEIHRKHFPQVEQTLSEEVLLVSSMPCFHLVPQYVLLGVAEALVTPSCSLLSFWLVPERMRGISMHFLTLFNGAGCFMGAFFVQTAHAGSQVPDTTLSFHTTHGDTIVPSVVPSSLSWDAEKEQDTCPGKELPGELKEDRTKQDELSLLLCQVQIFFTTKLFPAYQHEKVLWEKIKENRIRDAELAELRKIKDEELAKIIAEREEAKKQEAAEAAKTSDSKSADFKESEEPGTLAPASKEEAPTAVPPVTKVPAGKKRRKKQII